MLLAAHAFFPRMLTRQERRLNALMLLAFVPYFAVLGHYFGFGCFGPPNKVQTLPRNIRLEANKVRSNGAAALTIPPFIPYLCSPRDHSPG